MDTYLIRFTIYKESKTTGKLVESSEWADVETKIERAFPNFIKPFATTYFIRSKGEINKVFNAVTEILNRYKATYLIMNLDRKFISSRNIDELDDWLRKSNYI